MVASFHEVALIFFPLHDVNCLFMSQLSKALTSSGYMCHKDMLMIYFYEFFKS